MPATPASRPVNTQAPPEPPRPISSFNVTLSTDALLLVGAVVWLLWDRLMKPTVANRLEGVFAPIEEERRLTAILAQIGVITGASRVVLAAFHNGQLSRYGFHLQRLSTVNQYAAPGFEPMPHPIRDLPIGRVMNEVEMLVADGGWVETRSNDDLPAGCADHLRRNQIDRMICRLVAVGNLPIGILSIQYGPHERRSPSITAPPHNKLLESLFDEIAQIMRRRVIHPSRLKRICARFFGSRNPPAAEE